MGKDGSKRKKTKRKSGHHNRDLSLASDLEDSCLQLNSKVASEKTDVGASNTELQSTYVRESAVKSTNLKKKRKKTASDKNSPSLVIGAEDDCNITNIAAGSINKNKTDTDASKTDLKITDESHAQCSGDSGSSKKQKKRKCKKNKNKNASEMSSLLIGPDPEGRCLDSNAKAGNINENINNDNVSKFDLQRTDGSCLEFASEATDSQILKIGKKNIVAEVASAPLPATDVDGSCLYKDADVSSGIVNNACTSVDLPIVDNFHESTLEPTVRKKKKKRKKDALKTDAPSIVSDTEGGLMDRKVEEVSNEVHNISNLQAIDVSCFESTMEPIPRMEGKNVSNINALSPSMESTNSRRKKKKTALEMIASSPVDDADTKVEVASDKIIKSTINDETCKIDSERANMIYHESVASPAGSKKKKNKNVSKKDVLSPVIDVDGSCFDTKEISSDKINEKKNNDDASEPVKDKTCSESVVVPVNLKEKKKKNSSKKKSSSPLTNSEGICLDENAELNSSKFMDGHPMIDSQMQDGTSSEHAACTIERANSSFPCNPKCEDIIHVGTEINNHVEFKCSTVVLSGKETSFRDVSLASKIENRHSKQYCRKNRQLYDSTESLVDGSNSQEQSHQTVTLKNNNVEPEPETLPHLNEVEHRYRRRQRKRKAGPQNLNSNVSDSPKNQPEIPVISGSSNINSVSLNPAPPAQKDQADLCRSTLSNLSKFWSGETTPSRSASKDDIHEFSEVRNDKETIVSKKPKISSHASIAHDVMSTAISVKLTGEANLSSDAKVKNGNETSLLISSPRSSMCLDKGKSGSNIEMQVAVEKQASYDGYALKSELESSQHRTAIEHYSVEGSIPAVSIVEECKSVDINTEANCVTLEIVREPDCPSKTEVIKVEKPLIPTRKKLLVLDLNGLLVDIVAVSNITHRAYKRISGKLAFKRPFCDEFLDFCFEAFEIGVWSSRMSYNVDAVIDYVMGKGKKQQLLFSWDQSKCTRTNYKTIENSHKPLLLKELKKLWCKEEPNLPWEEGVYSPSNTLLIDDSPYKALCNPPHTAIFPHPYSYENEDDNYLGPNGTIRTYLEELAKADNVQEYVKEHPFGQQCISESHPSWKFYLRVIEQVKGQSKLAQN